ncbi:MAG: hypothetical protein ACPGVB_13295, partial [Chitinophagales bacterium]
MARLNLSEEDLQILNSKIGIRSLLADKTTNVEKALRAAKYELQIRDLQAKLVDLQNWVIEGGKKIVIL